MSRRTVLVGWLLAGMLLLAGGWVTRADLPASPTADDIMACARANLVEGTFHGTIQLDLTRPDYAKEYKLEAWTSGGDHALIRVLAPQDQVGSAYLQVGQDLWFYDPAAGQAISLPASALSENFLGADLSLEDFYQGTLDETFDVTLLGARAATADESSVAGDQVYQVRLVPKPEAPVVYGRIEILVRQSDCATLRMDYYDQRNTLIRQAIFSDFTTIKNDSGTRVYPLKLTFDDLLTEGSRTVETIESHQFDVAIPDEVFTLDCLTKNQCGSS